MWSQTPQSFRIGLIVLLVHLIVAITGPFWAPYGFSQMGAGIPLSGMSWAHPFGIDQLGRDVFSRVVHGSHIVILLSLSGTAIGLLVGAVLGLLSGYLGGWFDNLLQRLLEALISIPFLVLALIAIASAGPELSGNPILVVLVVALVYAPRIARIARAAAMDIATRDFVTVARLRGESAWSVMRRELLPNATGVLLVEFASARRLCAGAGRLSRLPRLRAAAADPGMGPDDQREPRPHHHHAHHRAGSGPGAGVAGRRLEPVYRGPGAHPWPHRAPGQPMTGAHQLLEVRNLSVAYRQGGGWSRAVDDVSFSLRPGEVFGLVGESGCGKSTVALQLLGFRHVSMRVEQGDVRFKGQALTSMSRAELDKLRGDRIAFVPQNPTTALNPGIRIGRQLTETMLAHGRAKNAEDAGAIAGILKLVGLPVDPCFQRRYPHQLSGGQQQRVCIAMALACDPDLLVLDEPTTGLDVTTQEQIISLLSELRVRIGVAMLYVTHDWPCCRRSPTALASCMPAG